MSEALIGCDKFDLDTPALCLDLDALEANISHMADFLRQRGKHWRPHQKCHKSTAIARKQLEAGALGVTCATVSEAEAISAAGIHDILLANVIAAPTKCERVATLCRQSNLVIACDHFAQIEPLAQACHRQATCCRVVVEVNIGLNRVGVRPGRDTLELAAAVDRLDGTELAGIMGYEGHLLQIANQDEKRREIELAMNVLVQCRDLLAASGLCCDVVSAGATGSYQFTADCAGVTELQAGGGIFGDPFYQHNCHVAGLTSALSILATVVSRPTLQRAVLDCGRKSLNPEKHPPTIKQFPDSSVVHLSAEHCVLNLQAEAQNLRIGDKVELIPGYSDLTTVLHERFLGFRESRLEVVWPIEARGGWC